jgi:hypothetical protein
MLVLISGGIAAYAQDPSSPAGSAAAAAAVSTTTSTTNSTSTTTMVVTSATSATSANRTVCAPPTQVSRLTLPITSVTVPTEAAFDTRGCFASIATVGGIFNVHIILRYAKPVTQYHAVLVANGTSYPLGNMVTRRDGIARMHNEVLLTPGTYIVSIKIFDDSSTPGQSTLVMQTGQDTIVSHAFPTASSNQSSSK